MRNQMIILVCWLFLYSGSSFSQANEITIFVNGKIFTANPKKPFAEAIAVKGEKILAVGKERRVRRKAGKKSSKVDLNGQLLMPGFIDSHNHAVGGGLALISASLNDEYIPADSLKKFAIYKLNNKSALTGGVFMITGLNMKHWEHVQELNEIFNSGDFSRVPVFLRSADGHTGWVNTAFLQKQDITEAFLQSLDLEQRTYFNPDEFGKPSGIITEKPVFEFYEKIMEQAEVKKQEAAKTGIRYLNSLGITAFLDPRYQDPSAMYKSLADQGALTAHAVVCLRVDPAGDIEQQLELVKRKQKNYHGTSDLYISGIKIFADGVAEYPNQTASLSRPYLNSGKNAPLLFEQSDFENTIIHADRSGLLIQVHTIGDAATEAVLNGFEEMRKQNRNRQMMHTLIHLQFVKPADFSRFKKLNLAASFSFLWAHADTNYTNQVKPYIDPEIYQWQYPANSMRKAGAVIAGGSDWPVSSPDPLKAIYVGETRTNETEEILNEHERMPRLNLLYAHTINAAKVLSMEKLIGSIEKGKLADLIILDTDITSCPARELRTAKVYLTLFRGKIIFKIDE